MPNPAKHNTGRVVSSPASAPLRASESLITVSCGPMAMAVGRRLKANVSTATTISQRGQPRRVASADSGTAVTLWRLARLAAVATRPQPEQHAPPVQRLRIKYAKRGRARFTSHRDFGRAFERALRRAGGPDGLLVRLLPAPAHLLRQRRPDRRGERGRVSGDRAGRGLRPGCGAGRAGCRAAARPGHRGGGRRAARGAGRPAHRLALAGRPGRRLRPTISTPPSAASWPSRKCWCPG